VPILVSKNDKRDMKVALGLSTRRKGLVPENVTLVMIRLN